MTLIDSVEGLDVIRQFTPAPWGTMMSNRSAVSCIYQVSDASNPENHTMIVTSLGNEKLEQKWVQQGLLASDVLAMTFSYWHVQPVKRDDGTTKGTKITFVTKMKPNGWVPDFALSKVQQA